MERGLPQCGWVGRKCGLDVVDGAPDLRALRDVRLALARIRDRSPERFEEYVKARWNMDGSLAGKLIDGMGAALTEHEARALTDEVKRDAQALWKKLWRLYDGQAHVALNYSSWVAYCEAEFKLKHSRAHQLLDAGKVLVEEEARPGSTNVESTLHLAKESQLRPLAKIELVTRAQIIQRVERAGGFGELTAAQVKKARDEVVDEKRRVEESQDDTATLRSLRSRLPPLARRVRAGRTLFEEVHERDLASLERQWDRLATPVPEEGRPALRREHVAQQIEAADAVIEVFERWREFHREVQQRDAQAEAGEGSQAA